MTQSAEMLQVPAARRGLVWQGFGFARSLDGVSLTLIWAAVGGGRVVGALAANDVSDALVAIMALPLIVLLPRQLGVLLWPLAATWRGRLDALEEYVVEWLAGVCLLILGLTLMTGVANVPSTIATVLVLLLATGSSLIAGFGPRSEVELNDQHTWLEVVRASLPITAALVLVAVPLALIRMNQPYPLQVGWGLFSFNFRILQFTELDHISIAPGLHTPIHASIFGVLSIATGAETEGLLWAAPLLLFASYGVGVFLLARRLLDNDLLALAAVWVAIWVLSLTTFQHLHGAGMRGVILAMWPWILLVLHRVTPDLKRDGIWESSVRLAFPLGAIVGVGLIRWFLPSSVQLWALLVLAGSAYASIHTLSEERRLSVGVLTMVAGSLTLIHIIEAPLFFALGVAFLLTLSWRPVDVPSRVVLGAGFAVVAAFITIQVAGDLTFGDSSIISRLLLGNARADAIPIPFEDKMKLFELGMTYTIIGVLGLSAVRLLIWPQSVHLASVATIAVAVFLYFVPESGLHRIMGPVIPLIGISVALEAYWVAQRLASIRWKKPPLALTGALVILAIIALTPHLTSSLRTQMQLPSQFGFPAGRSPATFSNITKGEYDAAAWVRDNTPMDWVLVSDPTTMFYMQGLTLRDQVAIKRAWVAESEYTDEDQARLSSLATSVFGAPNVRDALTEIDELMTQPSGVLLVISYRTLDWLLSPESLFRLTKPRETFAIDEDGLRSFCQYFEVDRCLSRFFTSDLVSVVYDQDGVVILIPWWQAAPGTSDG